VMCPAPGARARARGVTRPTAAQACEDLIAGGWARAQGGQGTLVAEQAPAAPPAAPTPRFEWTGHLSKSAQIVAADARRRGAYSQMTRTASGVISFAGGMPDSAPFPPAPF